MPISWPAPDPASPFFCHGPTLISFSGGRTSAYMLWLVLCAHGGILPDYVIVAFANTGRERAETLRFVHECETRWGVRVWWVEWRPPPTRRKKGDPPRERRTSAEKAAAQIAIVGFNSADRTGRWFKELIRRKQYLPNQAMRYCTTELKIRTMKHLMIALGFQRWRNIVGLRADEMHRVMKQVLANEAERERWVSTSPLAIAGITKRIVLNFWLGRNADPKRLTHPLPQGFDLGLRDYEGNCDLCFLKGRGKKARIIREVPGVEIFWIECEQMAKSSAPKIENARFDKRESVTQLAAATHASPLLVGLEDDDRDYDAECGVSCIASDKDEPIDDAAVEWLMSRLRQIAASPPVPMPKSRKPAIALEPML